MLFKEFFLLRIKLATLVVAGCACCLMARAQSTSNAVSSLAMPGCGDRAAKAILNASSSYVLDDKHVLGPADVVSFQILEDRDPARELKGLLEKEYYYQATVIVGLNLVNKVRGKVYVCT